jgi:acetyl-CoA acetyltransferase
MRRRQMIQAAKAARPDPQRPVDFREPEPVVKFPYQCPECAKSCQTLAGLKSHMRNAKHDPGRPD